MEKIITFNNGDPELDFYSKLNWNAGELCSVCFYKNKPVSVQLIDVEDQNLENLLNNINDGHEISVDFEWKPDKTGETHPISLFQFCSSKGILIIQNSKQEKSEILESFLNSNKFIGKGTHVDQKKLLEMFGKHFDIEDIQNTWLIPYDISTNFEEMIDTLVGPPCAQFKDKRISRSDWSQRPLSVKQILYSAFDAYGLYLAYKVLKEKYKQPGKLDPSKQHKHKSKDRTPRNQRREGDSKSETWSTKVFRNERAFHLRFDPDVPLRGTEIFKKVERDHPIFKERKDYNPMETLFYYMIATNKIKENFCCLCNQSFDDIKMHCWVSHNSFIPHLYFPIQTNKFYAKIKEEVKIGNESIHLGTDSFECSLCGRKSCNVHLAYSHIRLDHINLVKGDEDAEKLDVMDLFYNYFRVQDFLLTDPFPPTCKKCALTFMDEKELKYHVWVHHGLDVGGLWKHKPPYHEDDEFNTLTYNLGVDALNKTIYGEVIEGIICCWDCKIGFDTPAELFIHLFHKHTFMACFSTHEIDYQYCFLISRIPLIMQNVLQKYCYENAVTELTLASILAQDCNSDEVICNECKLSFHSQKEVWDHLIHNHLCLFFNKGKPVYIQE